MFSIQGSKAFVVGAAGGIGRALALEFSRRGAEVAAADIDAAGAEQTAQQITERGGRAIALQCNLADQQSLANAVAEAEAFLGEIDISANVVGVLLSGNAEDIPLAEWERIFQINFFGAARLTELMLPRMLARGKGYLVNTASVAGLYPFAITRIPYAASKAALISMTQNLAIYLKPKGISVSCLCPGPTATPIGEKSTTWTEGAPVVGPGRAYTLKTAQQAAQAFCDGMELQRVIIPSEEAPTLAYMQRYANSPDNFIYERIGQYACADSGRPIVDFSNPEILAIVQGVDASMQERPLPGATKPAKDS
ncbi:SDR family oxidoreductase [Halioxenophilus sp. WMMB6]|uniref:SDR family NAD(P)-dependent oxidoreductase n=1 Tax=Halioxenophilus sp. WMMB6 TaxID=3073815 RepID=UPI00295E4F0E|nr:SDR family oxidoreductase [Halioxenophilus sp. WMMB6]